MKQRLALLTAAFLLLGTSAANANSLTNTSPISGATIVTAPSVVTLTAQSALAQDGSTIQVTDPNGKSVDDGSLLIDGTSATIGLTQLTAAGTYTVTYQLLSDTDAPLQGSYKFICNSPSVSSAQTPATSTSATPVPDSGPASSNRGTTYLVLVMLVLACVVTVGLSIYARKLFKNR